MQKNQKKQKNKKKNVPTKKIYNNSKKLDQ